KIGIDLKPQPRIGREGLLEMRARKGLRALPSPRRAEHEQLRQLRLAKRRTNEPGAVIPHPILAPDPPIDGEEVGQYRCDDLRGRGIEIDREIDAAALGLADQLREPQSLGAVFLALFRGEVGDVIPRRLPDRDEIETCGAHRAGLKWRQVFVGVVAVISGDEAKPLRLDARDDRRHYARRVKTPNLHLSPVGIELSLTCRRLVSPVPVWLGSTPNAGATATRKLGSGVRRIVTVRHSPFSNKPQPLRPSQAPSNHSDRGMHPSISRSSAGS